MPITTTQVHKALDNLDNPQELIKLSHTSYDWQLI